MPNILKGTAVENEEVLTKNRALSDKLRRKKLSKMYENGEISSLFNDYNNYISTVQSDYESRKDKYTSYDTSESYRQSKESESSSLSQRLKSLLDLTGGISNYGGKSDLITSLNGAMGTLSGINDDLTNESNYWKTVGEAGVKNDDDYAGYVDRVSKIAADKAATQAETDRLNLLSLEEITAERDKYEKQAKEDNTSTNSFLGKILDWSSATTPNHSSWAEKEGSEYESKMALYDNIINKKSNEQLLSLIDDSQAKLFQDYVDAAKSLEAANNTITPNNAYAANYKNEYSSKKQKSAEAKRQLQDATSNLSEEEYRGLLDYYVNQYNDQLSEDFKTNVQSYAGEHPVLSSAGSVLLTMGAGVEGALKSLFAVGGYTAPEHLTPSLTAKSEIRNTVTESIDSNIGKFAYGTGMSMADSAVNMLLSKAGGPAGEALGLFIMGGGAAGTATQDALDNGATPTQAGLSGLAHGIAEALFEKISLDKILSIDSPSGWKEILKSIGYQFVTEGSEELFTDLANAISDSFILGDKSTLALEYQSYIDAGMSVEDATAKVAGSFAEQLGQSFLGGAVAGGLMGGGVVAFQSTVGNAIYDHSTGEALMSQDAGVSFTIDYAKNLDKSSSAYKYAQKLSQKQSNKETIKASNIGKLGRLSSRQTITENGNLYKQGIESRLVELGTSVESASKLSGTILSQITGESVEPIKSLSLSNNKNAQQVLTEIKDTLSADSDNKSQWVQDIQDKVYEAYGRRQGVKEENLQDFVSQVKAYEAAQNVPAEDDVSGADEISTSSPESEPVGTQRTIVTTKSTNKAVTVKSATRSDSGGLVLTLSDGSTASVNDLSMTKSQRAAFSAASEYGINSAEFLAGYVNSDEANIDAYSRAYYQIAKSAEYGISSEKDAVAKSSPDAISEDAARSAYAYGKSRNITNNTAGVTYLNIKSISTNKMREILVLDAIGKKYGLQFFIVDSLNKVGENANGNYKEGTNKIWIGLDSDYDSILRTAGHEVFHFIEQYNKDAAADLKNYVIEALKADAEFDYESRLKEIKELYRTVKGAEISDDYAETELAADAMFQVFQREEFVEKLCNEDRRLAEKIKSKLREFISFLKTQVYKISKKDAVAKSMMKDIKKLDTIANMFDDALEGASKIAGADNISTPQNPGAEIKSSIKNNERIIDEAEGYGLEAGTLSRNVVDAARSVMYEMSDTLESMANILPPDVTTRGFKGAKAKYNSPLISNSSYGGSLDNSLVCIRSLGFIEIVDRIGEIVKRPLSVKEQLYVAQRIFEITDTPQCIYCYVAADRMAYKSYLTSYLDEANKLIQRYKESGQNNPGTRSADNALYIEYLNGSKDTKQQWNRYSQIIKAAEGKLTMPTAEDLASDENANKATEDKGKAAIVKDALAYAQSASWAKLKLGYVAYDGQILELNKKNVKMLNSEYGLRMYSFSDFSPAFILENMQMILDASAKGLKMLAYTKELDFVRIFAGTGININVSVFASSTADASGNYSMDGMQGADWEQAIKLRDEYSNVGITMVTTNDAQTEWALSQDWIDVVIPTHSVRSKAVLKELGYGDYSRFQADKKTSEYEKGSPSSIYPSQHHNDRDTYLKLCKQYGLTPRFSQWIENDNYMKLVNETRQSDIQTKPVQPVYSAEAVDAARSSLETFQKRGGYDSYFGLDQEQRNDYADEWAQDIVDGMTKKPLTSNPIHNSGIKSSLKAQDSEGTALSEQQQKYFENSQVTDENGNLLVVYHGTKKDFTAFDRKFIGSTGRFEGSGFNFTPSKERASSYANGVNILAGYVNIENPLSDVKKTISVSQLARLIRNIDPTGDNIIANYAKNTNDYGSQSFISRESIVTARAIWNYSESDTDIYSEISSADSDAESLISAFSGLGYDGLIHYSENGKIKTVITFESSQFKNADNKTPTTSQDIRYSLKSVPPVIPTSDKWKTTLDTDEAKSRFPNLWDIAADESDTRNPTQISSTVSSYRKIYDLLHDEGFNGTILDASSGLGYGTKAGIEEYGFSVDDVEPYPDKSYSPKYTDYSALNKKYDVIISNAVLNVLPQDQRDALVVKMGSMLNSGGRLFVNVRGDDVNTLSKNKENINISPMEWYVANTGSYQKGFTRSELVSYLRDALGDKYDVQPTTKFGKTSAIVTKADIRYSLKYNTRADKVLEKLKNTNDFSEAIEYGKLLVDLVNQAQRESTVPETTTFQQASINRIVNKYADRFNLDADGKAQARKSIVDLFTFIADSDQVSWDEISPMLWDTVVSMAENYGKSDLELKLNPAYEQIRNFFKHEKLFLSPGEDHEIATLFGTKYGNVSQQLRGKLNIKRADWSRTSRGKSQIIDAGGRRLDELVSEFNATFPENVRIEGTAFGDTFVNLYDLLGKAWEKTYFVKGSKQSKMSMESSDYDADYEQWNENRLYVVSDEALTASAYELFDDYFDAKEYKTEGQKFQKLLVDTKIKYQHRIESINAKLSNAKDAINYQKQLRREALLNQRGRQLARDYSRKLRNVQTTLRNMLEHPSKGKFVPDSLVASVSAFCDNITLDLNGFGKTSLGNLREAASMMQTQYNALEQTDPGTFDKAVSGWIAETVNALNNPKMTAMEYANIVKSLYQTLKGVTTNIRNADRAFGVEQRKTITGMSLDAHNSFAELKDKNVLLYKGRAIEIDWSSLKPYAMFETLGNSTFKRLYWELEQGEGVYAKDIDAAKKHHKSLSEKYDIKNKSLKEKVSFESSFGEKVTLTRGELMSLYLYMQRDQAMSHLKRGGFVRKSNIKISESSRKGTFSTDTTHLSGQDYVTIGKLLSENEKGYAKELSNYLGTTMGAKGNSVFKQLYGFDKFTEENYFPIITASDYLNAMLDDKGEVQLTGMGFLKDLVPNASNPIALMDVQEVFAQHVNEMSRYHALVLPLQNITKVLNFRAVMPMTNDDGGAIKFESISADIRSKFGSAGLNSLKQFIRDVNGNIVKEKPNISDKMISLFKKSATMLSLSTIIQQPTAILRAQAYIDTKYFVSLKGLKVAMEYKQLMEYAPIAILKRMGSFDTSTGASASKYITGSTNAYEKVSNAMSWLPEAADELGWSMLWVAVKNEVAASGRYEIDSEEFYQAAGERFTEVANKSQVYDSVFSRAEIMRSKNLGAKLVTPFMAEPLTTLNMGYTAILDAKRSKTKAGAMRCVRTFYALLSSIALNALLKSLVTAARKDDDDEERGMLEVYATEVITNFLDDVNVLNLIPIARDINSLANGYDVERADLSLATKLINYIVAIANKTASDETITLDDYMKLIGSAANFFGIPVANAWRDFKAIGNVYTNVKGLITGKGDESSWVGFEDNLKQEIKGNTWGGKIYTLMTKNTSRARELYNAMVSGDAAKAEKLREMWKSTGKDDAYIDSQLTSCLSMKDARVAKAAEARQKADTSGYQSLIDDIMSDGFSKEMAVGAVDSYISRKKSKDASEAQSEDDGEEASVSIYSNQDVVACLQSDDISGAKKIINYLVDERVKNGKTKAEANASIKSSITSKFKPLYVEAWKERDQSEMTRIRKLLIQSGLYGKSADIDELLKGWRTSK